MSSVGRMVAGDGDDLHRQFADPLLVEQIAQAMVELRHQNEHAHPLVRRHQLPVHAMVGAQRRDRRAQAVQIAVALEHHPQEEAPRLAIVELARFQDITALREDRAAHMMDDARPVGAAEDKGIGLGHVALLCF